MYKESEGMLKVKNLIKNTPSKIHHIYNVYYNVLRIPSNI